MHNRDINNIENAGDTRFKEILWIGTFAEDEYFKKLQADKLYYQNAANRVENHYLTALNRYKSCKIKVLSGLVTVLFPKNKRIIVRKNLSKIFDRITIENVGYINIPCINILVQSFMMWRAAIKWCRSDNKKNALIIIYSMRIPYLLVAKVIKKRIPDAVIVNIVPDLPQYMKMTRKGIAKGLSRINNYITRRLQKYVDGFVLYAEAMASNLGLSKETYIVIEGIFENGEKQYKLVDRSQRQIKRYAYFGGINKAYGVENLVQGFINAQLQNAVLELYGTGEYVSELINLSKKNNNVQYCGVVSPEDAFNIMQSVDILINPRSGEREYTKYSCPSKILEYMASGTPVLMTQLLGIPMEYYDYVYCIEDSSIEGIEVALRMVHQISIDERLAKAKLAKQYILNNKSSDFQVKRLFEFCERLPNQKR